MKLPVNGRWRIDQSTDKGLGILATKNLSFDQGGLLSLAPRTINVFDTVDDAQFEVPVSPYISNGRVAKLFTTEGNPFTVNINVVPVTISEDGLANQPTGTNYSAGVRFNGSWVVSESADLHSFDGSSWTDQSVSLTSAVPHPLCVMKSNNTLLVGNGNQVKQYNTSYTETTNLTLPAGTKVSGIAYNRNMAAVITWNEDGEEAWLYIWDAATAAANYAYTIGARRGYWVVPYQSGFALFNGNGKTLYWSDGLIDLAGLPSSYTSAELADFDDTLDVAHSAAALVDNGRLYFNISAVCDSKNQEQNRYNPYQPSGIWCYDPAVGLYHRGAPSGAKMVTRTVTTANVDTTTNVITTTNVPETGTEVVYTTDSTVLTPLAINTTYYIIKLTSTTMKLATSRANALAGTAIDLTGTGNNAQYFVWFPQSDFGQLAVNGYGGFLRRVGSGETNISASFFSLFSRYCYGFGTVTQLSTSASVDSFGYFLDRFESRGYFVTQKMFSPNITDTWQELVVKARNVKTELDKIIVKCRAGQDPDMPVIAWSTSTLATWVDANTFTTTTDLSNVEAGYEVEFVAGAGSGYLAHITSLSNNAGT